jgi:cytochrome P450
VGSLLELRRDPLSFMTRVAREYGDVARVRIGLANAYLVSHPEYVKEVLVTQQHSFKKGLGLEWAKSLLGEGLLTTYGGFHRRQRRLMQPSFHRQRIQAYGEIMVHYAEQRRDHWQPGQEIGLHEEMSALTMAIVAKALFGVEVEGESREIGEALTTVLEFFPRFSLPFARLLQLLPLPGNRRFARAQSRLDETVYRLIEEGRRSGEDRGDLLSMLLAARDEEGDGGGMTDRQLRDEVMTLFLAGHETTASALTWTFYLLSLNPEAEARLLAELDAVLSDRPPTVDDLPRLRYTEGVFAESLRLYPPAWAIDFRALNDVVIGPYRIEKDAYVATAQWVVHRDPRFWPDPERFDPDRWTPEARAARPKFAYFPYGAGSRQCIAESFAGMEGVLTLATIAQRWRLGLRPGQIVELQPVITLRPRHDIKMIVGSRVPATRSHEVTADPATGEP